MLKKKFNNIGYIIIDVVPECLNVQLRATKKEVWNFSEENFESIFWVAFLHHIFRLKNHWIKKDRLIPKPTSISALFIDDINKFDFGFMVNWISLRKITIKK